MNGLRWGKCFIRVGAAWSRRDELSVENTHRLPFFSPVGTEYW